MKTFVFKNLDNENQICIICTWAPKTAYDLFRDELAQNVEYVNTFYVGGSENVNDRSNYYSEFHNYFEKKYSKKTIRLQEDSYEAKWYECDNANELTNNIQDIYNEFLNLRHPKIEEKQPVKITQTTLF